MRGWRSWRTLANCRCRSRCARKKAFVLTLVDGLSNGEKFLMEAVYRPTAFPYLFVGGSAVVAGLQPHPAE